MDAHGCRVEEIARERIMDDDGKMMDGKGMMNRSTAGKARKAESELWLGSSPHFRAKQLWNSQIDHYTHEYPETAYLGALRLSTARIRCDPI